MIAPVVVFSQILPVINIFAGFGMFVLENNDTCIGFTLL